jgi:hypothetical protein
MGYAQRPLHRLRWTLVGLKRFGRCGNIYSLTRSIDDEDCLLSS